MTNVEFLPADSDPDKLCAIIDRDGAVVLTDALDESQVSVLNERLDPHVDRRPGFRAEEIGSDFYGSNTVRVQSIVKKCPEFVTWVLLNEALLALADRILLPFCGDYWMSQAETIFIGPGNPAQELHRDDANWEFAARLGIPLQLSVLVALGDYDEEVGATRVVVNTHREGPDAPIDPTRAVPVELPLGSMLVYVGSLAHGGGANRTADRWRKALYMSLLLGWLTPEECVPLGIGADTARTLPMRARELLGFANIRQAATLGGPAASLQMWQMDAEELERCSEWFHHR